MHASARRCVSLVFVPEWELPRLLVPRQTNFEPPRSILRSLAALLTRRLPQQTPRSRLAIERTLFAILGQNSSATALVDEILKGCGRYDDRDPHASERARKIVAIAHATEGQHGVERRARLHEYAQHCHAHDWPLVEAR